VARLVFHRDRDRPEASPELRRQVVERGDDEGFEVGFGQHVRRRVRRAVCGVGHRHEGYDGSVPDPLTEPQMSALRGDIEDVGHVVAWKPLARVIETERLTLRTRDERDVEWYRELVGERGEPIPTFEESRARLARSRDLTMETGIGALAICRRGEGDAIGYCALVVGRASLDEPEIAFELLQRFHGQGYATEAAQALVVAAEATGRRRLWATVGAWNAPSLRVLEKVGFRRDHNVTDDRGEVVYLVRDL
jgi:RimJ/RimL family protein N-acetyltransferase